MSKFENYDSVSQYYDEQRVAFGSDLMAAMIQFQCGKPLKDLHVLDAGCGTGNYSVDLIKHSVGHMTLLDASPGMLGTAKSKLADHITSGRIKDVIEAKLPALPFADNTFDAVMFNLVLHHLESGTGGREFKNTTEALKEGRRVLKPGGLIIVSTCLPETYQHALWYTQILTKLTSRYIKRFPYIAEWKQIFDSVKVKCVQKLNLLWSNAQRNYDNVEGPLDENWRKTSSYWAEITDEELKELKTFITDLKGKGELEKWIKARDHLDTSGSLTIFAQRRD